jgi:DNA-binding CsgD family transcriptional regulator
VGEVSIAAQRRQVAHLERVCGEGLDLERLRSEVLTRLRQVLTVEAAFFATVDPATMLFSTAYAEDPLHTAGERFLDNEFGQDDVNKFVELASGRFVATLDRSTSGDRAASARHREIMAPLGLGDELRVALMSGGHCWGVLCLHRADAVSGFCEEDIAVVYRLAPAIATGLRRAISLAGTGPVPVDGVGPGIVVVGSDLAVVSLNSEAEQWIARLAPEERGMGSELPAPMAAAALHVLHSGRAATARLRRTGGGWLSLHASSLQGPRAQVVLVLDSATEGELSSLLLATLGLTPAQTRVTGLVLRGMSTREIMTTLQISTHTVQEHLRAAFDQLGIGSRRELVAVLTGRAGQPS